jgi:aminopeptidase N
MTLKNTKNVVCSIMGSMLVVLSISSPALAQPARRVATTNDQSDRPKIDIEAYSININIVPNEHKLDGVAEVRFRQLDRQNFATFDLDRRLRVSKVTIGTDDARFRQFDLDSTIEVEMGGQQFANSPTLKIEYSGVLDAEEDKREPVLARISEETAFLLYQAKWFPSNGLFTDKAQMRLHVNAPSNWTIVTDLPAAGGDFSSTDPSFWGMVAAGNYTRAGVNSEKSEVMLYTLDSQANGQPLAEAAGRILDFYKETFGPPPTPQFRIVQVHGANWTSQWAPGTLLLPTSQFRPDFDLAVLARSLAHQWFPLKIAVEDASADAWLVDGMAVFASLMYFDKALAPAEAQEQINKALVKALGYEGDVSIRRAGGLDRDSAEYHALVEYKGGYVIRMLRWVMGEDKFNTLMAQYLQKFQNTPASTEAFTDLASKVAGEDLTYFFDQWLNSSGVPEFKDEYTVFRTKDGYKVMGRITQDLDLFRMPVELQILTDGDPEYQRVEVKGPSSDFDIVTQRKPKDVVIDPRGKTLRLSPDINVSVYINRGEEFAGEGRYNEAVDEFQRALDLDAHNSLALFRMGEALFELGNLQAASNVFSSALNGDLKPKWTEVWAYINKGKIYDARGDRERAVNEYQKAVNTGDDAYGAQAEATKYLGEPFRRSGRTIG